MATFKVTSIIDGDTISVIPNWTFGGRSGNVIKISGYPTPIEARQEYAINKLKTLLKDQTIELKNARKFATHSDALLCSVYLNGVDIAQYFPEFRNQGGPFF